MTARSHAHKVAPEAPAEEVVHSTTTDEFQAADAKREFSSITITIDHLREVEPHTVVKMVLSTECAQESLLAQLRYFGQLGLLTDAGFLAMAHQGLENDVVYVYTPSERRTNVIVDGPVWGRILEEAGTMLEATEQVILLATDLQRHARAKGSDPRLTCFVADPAPEVG
jgi:hypothetical protein